MSGTCGKVLAVSLICSVSLGGCKTLEDKIASMDACDWTGTTLGAVAGGIAGGMLLGGGDGRILGAMAGAAIGGFLGNQIAAMLDCHDKKAAATAAAIAADAPDGEAVVWASQGANVDMSKVPVTAKPAAAVATAEPAKSTKTAKKGKKGKAADTTTVAAAQTAPVVPEKPKEEELRPEQKQEAAKLAMASHASPVASEGKSGAWGVSRPVGPLTRTAEGRMCRQIENSVYDAQGQVSTEVTTNCLDAENKWNVAWGWGYAAGRV